MRLRLVFAVIALIGLALVGGGVYSLVKRETGTRARATVGDCVGNPGRYTTQTCSGTWIVGGSLLHGGHVVFGTIDGADSSDIGKTIDVRVSGGEAFTLSLRVPIILLIVGGLIAGGGVFFMFKIPTGRRITPRAKNRPPPNPG
jgi:hypothetical protein